MKQAREAPSEAELHAYVDGMLGDDAAARIAEWLENNPTAAAEVEGWREQNSRIRAAFSGYARSEPSDADLFHVKSPTRRSLTSLWQAAAAVAIFAAGAGVGHVATDQPAAPARIQSTALAQESADSFSIYSVEVRHPVEVGADQRDHLVAWLGKRLDHTLKAPDLSAFGHKLVGGRLVPVNGKAGAMLMYENDAGSRLTLLVGRNPDGHDTGFRFADAGPVRTFYWIDGDLGYAISGEVGRPELEALAEAVYRQLQPHDTSS